MLASSPIVVVDSGLGGLSAVRALREVLPNEELVYLGDTGRGPYSNKSEQLIKDYACDLVEQARAFRPKHVLIACNVMASIALPQLRSQFQGFSISGIVDAASRLATERAGRLEMPMIGVMAAEATIRSKGYEKAIHRRRHHARLLLRPTPLLDTLAEEGREEDDMLLRLSIKQYVNAMVARGANVIILGSVWHSMLKREICRVVGDQIAVVDSAESCAEDVARRLRAAGLLRSSASSNRFRCVLTDQTPRFEFLSKRILGCSVEPPTITPVSELQRERPDEAMRVPA
jgi:glutamate racemase